MGKKRSTPLSPNRLSIVKAAKLLSVFGEQRLSPRDLRADISAGAPSNADGTIDLIHYAAWLAQRSRGNGGARAC